MRFEYVEAITNESERHFPEMAPGEPGSKDAYVFISASSSESYLDSFLWKH